MDALIQDSDFTLYVGDVCEVLAELPAESVHCVVTSPPYWGLRDYGTGAWDGGDAECDHLRPANVKDPASTLGTPGHMPGANTHQNHSREPWPSGACGKCGATRTDLQLGLEPTPEEYVANMVDVFREVRRVLRRDGTCWLNLGDSYAAGSDRALGRLDQGRDIPRYGSSGGGAGRKTERSSFRVSSGLKPKDLVGIPWRVAFALQADGWYLRSDIIWAKPNPMPESVTDRPTKAHEYVFLLTKSPRYFFDADAVREPHTDYRESRANGRDDYGGKGYPTTRGGSSSFLGNHPAGRNLRSVWEIATQPYPEAHFATFPEALVERCVKAGTSEKGCCPECGAPWVRVVERAERPDVDRGSARLVPSENGRSSRKVGQAYQNWLDTNPTQTLGWKPSCDHDREPVPCTVADIFMGSGTTALVARKHGRRAIGVELSPEYARLASERLSQLSLLAAPA